MRASSRGSWGRWVALAAAAASLTLAAGCSQPGGAQTLAAAVTDPYARPGRLVALPDGRKLNLRCRGRGAPTVILESGFGVGSSAWFKVQPELSKTTRVCAYDRAGYGFSDPGPEPRDAAAIARDLDQALTAAGIRGPFIVVGHSAGGLYARVFAARRPKDVQAILLLDPTVEHRAPAPVNDGLDGLRARIRRCLATTQAAPPPPVTGPEWSGCLPGKPNPHDLEIAQRPETWEAQLSELDELFGRASEQTARAYGQLAAIPIQVITASATARSTPSLRFDNRTVLEAQHLAMAQVSREPSQRTVLSSHLVMIDRPDAVLSALAELIAAARAHRAPAPLPPSESDAVPDTTSFLDDLRRVVPDALAPRDETPTFPTN